MYKRIQAKSALNKLSSNYLPYNWDLNIYRGCSHRCQYCYALYSHQYVNDGKAADFFGDIYIKENIVELLEERLKSRSWQGEAINLGGVTDSYQAIEAKERLMPQILRLLIKYRNPVIISTKSKLILRDYDLWAELAKVAEVGLAVSLTTFDERVYKKTEPNSSLPQERLEVLRKFRDTKVHLGVLAMPILPYLTDGEENLSNLFEKLANIPVDYILCGLLNLRSQTRTHFLSFIKQEFPEHYEEYLALYPGSFVSKVYRQEFYQRVRRLKQKYGIKNDYRAPQKTKEQLSLI